MKKKIPSFMEGIPEETREEFYKIFEGCLLSAVYLVETNELLCPFAVTLSKDDKIAVIGDLKEKQSHWAEDIVYDLQKQLLPLRDGLKAAAIISGRGLGKYDAFGIAVEHCECGASEIIVPFVRRGNPKRVKMKWRAAVSHRIEKYLWADKE